MKYKLIPASEVRPDQPRVWCDRASTAGVDFERTGTPPWALNTAPYGPYRHSHAIVEDSPRFVVKKTSAWVTGEPWVVWCRNKTNADRTLTGPWTDGFVDPSKRDRRNTCPPMGEFYIVDLHDSWHRERAGQPGVTVVEDYHIPAPTTPTAPTDAEIVAAWEARCRNTDAREPMMRDFLRIGTREVSMADIRAAWSRELARRSAEAREKERRMVAVQIDDASAEDV